MSAAALLNEIPGEKVSHQYILRQVSRREPVTSIALPLWVESGKTPQLFYEGETAPICAEPLHTLKEIKLGHASIP